MKKRKDRSRRDGLTLIEVLVIAAIIAVLAGLLLPAFVHCGCRSTQTNCVSNLRQTGTAFRLWADDNNGFYPMHFVGNPNYPQLTPSLSLSGQPQAYLNAYKYFQTMSNELSATKILICPSDNRKPPTNFPTMENANVSYFVGLDADQEHPQMFLTGDRNLEVNAKTVSTGPVTLGTNDTLAWSQQIHRESGDVALADGSSQKFSSRQLQSHFQKNYTNATRLVMP